MAYLVFKSGNSLSCLLTVFAASLCADELLKPAALFSLYSFFNKLLNFLDAPFTIGHLI